MGRTALLIIDMISTFDFEDGEKVAASAREAVPRIAGLAARARDGDGDATLLAYVNDNYEQWNETRDDLIERMREGPYADMIEPIVPSSDLPFILKGRHSIFYGTPVDHMLREEGVERIVMTGVVTEQCILYSALDAYLRGFAVAVPRDAVGHIHEHLADAALEMMETNLHAEVTTAGDVSLS